GYADDRVPWLDGFAVEHPGPFHDADNRAADIVFARLIEAGQLSGFAADKRTIVFRAGLREAFDDFGEDARLQFAGADIVQEEQRLRPEHRDVINAMVDEVLTDGVVPPQGEGNLQLGAHAIHAGNQHRPPVFPGVERKQAAEPANLAEHFSAM